MSHHPSSQTFSPQSLNTNSPNTSFQVHQESFIRSTVDPQPPQSQEVMQQPLEEASETPPITRRFDWDKHTTFQRSARYYGPTSFTAVVSYRSRFVSNFREVASLH